MGGTWESHSRYRTWVGRSLVRAGEQVEFGEFSPLPNRASVFPETFHVHRPHMDVFACQKAKRSRVSILRYVGYHARFTPFPPRKFSAKLRIISKHLQRTPEKVSDRSRVSISRYAARGRRTRSFQTQTPKSGHAVPHPTPADQPVKSTHVLALELPQTMQCTCHSPSCP
jgi:hypothetical protein